MTDEFYNSYHFVPLETLFETEQLPREAEGFRARGPGEGRSHDRYGTDRLHGRIICRLTLEQPLAVGGQQRKPNQDDYTFVEPYVLHDPARMLDYPALPASSLKGLITSLAETASASALRVLSDTKPVSWRVPASGRALSALGLLVPGEDGKLRLRPLTAPTIVRRNQVVDAAFTKWHELFKGKLPLKLSIGYYEKRKKEDWPPNTVLFAHSDFMTTIDGSATQQLFPKSGACYFMRAVRHISFGLDGLPCDPNAPVDKRIKKTQKGNFEYILGLNWRVFVDPGDQLQTVQIDEAPGYVCGFIRVLGGEGRDMAVTKWHEVFIPYPKEAKNRPTLSISKQALATFQALADERTKDKKPTDDTPVNELLPYTPFENGSATREDRKPDHTVKLRPGQIVYFDIGVDENNETVVTAISFSSIWRGHVPRTPAEDEKEKPDAHIASMRDFFPEELRPMHAKRKTISPAEWLFGFVSEDEKPEGDTKNVAYRGRVRFSAGRLAQPPDDPDDLFMVGDYPEQGDNAGKYIRLRELSSPKPPSPAMYFQPRASRRPNSPNDPLPPIAKHELRTSDQPQGRKMYLHRGTRPEHRKLDNTVCAPWETADADASARRRKLAVRLLCPKAVEDAKGFWFHLDFDNLSDEELDLLCYALRPGPDDRFRHKLGLGKPLGLGTVRIQPVALLLVDREKRYREETDPFAAPRYHSRWLAAGVSRDDLPPRYSREARELNGVTVGQGERDIGCHDRAKRHADRMDQMNLKATKKALELLGDPTLHQDAPTHTPLAPDQTDPEKDTYKWFAGKGRPREALEPITANTRTVRKLRR